MKNNLGLVAYAKSKLSLPTIYMLGGFGRVLTGAMIDRRIRAGCSHTIRNEATIRAGIGRYVFDCNGLIKAYLWEQSLGKVTYEAVPNSDLGSTALYHKASSKGELPTMPDIPGLLVFTENLGHVGIYIGRDVNGVRQYIECTTGFGIWGVGQTNDLKRKWKYWGKYHLIEYLAPSQSEPVVIVKEIFKPYEKVFEDNDIKVTLKVEAK